MITHRLAGLQDVDEVIVLGAGCAVERATHAELLAKEGVHRGDVAAKVRSSLSRAVSASASAAPAKFTSWTESEQVSEAPVQTNRVISDRESGHSLVTPETFRASTPPVADKESRNGSNHIGLPPIPRSSTSGPSEGEERAR
jgi:hypothetical protein